MNDHIHNSDTFFVCIFRGILQRKKIDRKYQERKTELSRKDIMIKKSENAFCFSIGNKKYLFNANTLKMFEVEEDQYKLVEAFDEHSELNQNSQAVKELIDEGFFVFKELKYMDLKKKRYEMASKADKNYISYLRISLTEGCNMRCKYCFVAEEFEKKKHSMDEDKFISIIEDFITHNYKNNVSIQYFGGEPLLKMNLIKIGNEMLKSAIADGKIKSANQEVVTNGTLINEDIINYFHENDIKCTISLDGLKEINDRNRIFADGSGTYDTVVSKCQLIKSMNGRVSFLMTPSKDNLDYLPRSIQYMIDELGADEININAPQPRVDGWDVDGAFLADKIIQSIEICQDCNIPFNHPASNLIFLLQRHELQRYSCIVLASK